MNSPRKIRVLLAKPGLDTHERGVKLVAAYLRDAGMEVIYTGVFQTTDSIIHTALQEDVDIIGLSYLSGGHQLWTQEIVDGLEKIGMENVTIICGGIIPEEDMGQMEVMGVKGIYGPGTDMEKIVEDIQTIAEIRSRENR